MAHNLEPVAGSWYLDTAREEEFEVTGVDLQTGSVEIQWADGNPEELDLDAWYAMTLELLEDDTWGDEEDEDELDDGEEADEWGEEDDDDDADEFEDE